MPHDPVFFTPHAAPFHYPGGDHGVLLIHGFTACPAQMIPLGKQLHEAGFSVHAIRLPGHGTSPADMKQSTWQQWLEEARTAARELRRQYRHFSVCGLSMGGALALILAAEMDLTACVTLAAPIAPANALAPVAFLLHPFYPTVHARENRVTPYPEYDQGYQSYPTKKVSDLMRIIRMTRKALPHVTCPLLSVQSRRDKTITPNSMDAIQAGAVSAVKEKVWLDNAPHVVTLSDELPKITSAMIPFLRAQEKK